MGAAAVPIGLGVGSLLMGSQANSDASHAADRSNRNAQKLTDRQTKLYDEMLANVHQADSAGAFDPSANLARLDADTARFSELDKTAAAASARVAGYRPGDTAPAQEQHAITDAYKLKYADMANQIRNDAFSRKQNAYASVNGGGLNPGINYYGNQQQLSLSRLQNPGTLLSSIMPFLNPPRPVSFGDPARYPRYPSGTSAGGGFPLYRNNG